MRLPRLIAHRGASTEAPENTLASFRAAAAAGAGWIEFDVRLSRDGVPVVFHDDMLDARTDGTGPVADRSLDQLRTLDAGSWFGAAWSGERIPTLAEVIRLVRAARLGMNVELKPNPGEEERTARAVSATLRAMAHDLGERVLLSSFRVAALAASDPRWRRALLVGDPGSSWEADLQRLGCVSVHPRHDLLTGPDAVARFGRAAGLVVPFTVNDPVRAGTLFAWGVDALFTDDPAGLSRAGLADAARIEAGWTAPSAVS